MTPDMLKAMPGWRLTVIAASALLMAGCATTGRVPYTAAESATATIANIPDARVWADDISAFTARMQGNGKVADLSDAKFLALSGGGAEGAYGAGFLACWSKTGNRPDFDVVTGSSVGALIAPFAFWALTTIQL